MLTFEIENIMISFTLAEPAYFVDSSPTSKDLIYILKYIKIMFNLNMIKNNFIT